MGVATPISIVNTNTKSKSVFDIQPFFIGKGVLGLTKRYKDGSYLSPTLDGRLTKNYGYTYIYINTLECTRLLSEPQRKATIAHEFGHAMGLSHKNKVASSIMCQAKSGFGVTRTATRAGKADLKAINHLY